MDSDTREIGCPYCKGTYTVDSNRYVNWCPGCGERLIPPNNYVRDGTSLAIIGVLLMIAIAVILAAILTVWVIGL